MMLTLILLVASCYAEHATHKLNFAWSKRELHSPLAKEIRDHQSKCTNTVRYHPQSHFGMGSEVHVWSQALCISMQEGVTLLQLVEPWIWNEPEFCSPVEHVQPFSCYFNVALECHDSVASPDVPISHDNRFHLCPKYIHDGDTRRIFRSAAMEYLFSNLNVALIDEAQRAIPGVFGDSGIPPDLITVHVRWGDKSSEMTLVTENEFYQAIEKVVVKNVIAEPHVYISTESPEAIVKLQEEINRGGKSWKLHYFAPLVATNSTKGASAKNTLVALLLAMEAKHFILTSGSNWSRLMNELRTNVVDVACGNCTDMVDLRQAAQHWMQDW